MIEPVPARSWTSTFESLHVRNYRIYFSAQLVSVNGNWMQRVAQAWLVLHLTGSGLALGITFALQTLPALLLSSYGGLVADRVDKRRLLTATQAVGGLLGIGLGALTLTGAVQLWMIFVFALALGLVTCVDSPARLGFVSEMVGSERITNAVSLNSSMATAARMTGPAIAGVLIATVGTGWCFLINGISYFAVSIAMRMMRAAELRREAPVVRGPGQVRDGLRYSWRSIEIRRPLLLMFVVGTVVLNWNTVLPLLASQTFHSGVGTYGALLSVLAAGSFAGALISAYRARADERFAAVAAIVLGALLTLAALAPVLPLEYAALVPVGVAVILVQTSCNSLLQVHSEPAMRGRVMSLYFTAVQGSTAIGGPLVGALADHYSARASLLAGAIAAAVAGGWLLAAGRRR